MYYIWELNHGHNACYLFNMFCLLLDTTPGAGIHAFSMREHHILESDYDEENKKLEQCNVILIPHSI